MAAIGEMDDGDFAVAGGSVFVSDPIAVRRKRGARRALIVGDDLEGLGVAIEGKGPQGVVLRVIHRILHEEESLPIAAKRGHGGGKAVEAEDFFFGATTLGTDLVNLSDVGGRGLNPAEEYGLAIGRPNGARTVALRERDFGTALQIEAPNFRDPLVGGIAAESDSRAVGRDGRVGKEHVRGDCRFFAGAIVQNKVGVFGAGLRGIVGKNAIVGGGEQGIARGREVPTRSGSGRKV